MKKKISKDNLKKKHVGETVAKQKQCKENTVVIHNIFFFKKSYKANLSTSSIYKKTDKGYLKKKEVNFG